MIPRGAAYIQANGTGLVSDGVTVEFPETVSIDDQYMYGDYRYFYEITNDDTNEKGWRVALTNDTESGIPDTTKTSYGEILSEINGKPVISVNSTFRDCIKLTTAQTIPNSVTNMFGTFCWCKNLTTIEVNCNPTVYDFCLSESGVVMIKGSCSQDTIDALMATK